MHLVNLLEQSARKYAWRRCFTYSNGHLRFRSLNNKVSQLALGLKEKLGIKKNDKVAILLNNCPEFIQAFFAILKAGAVCVPINVFLAFEEISYIIKDSQVKLLISSAEFRPVLEKIAQAKSQGLDDFAGLENIVLTDKQIHPFLYWPQILCRGERGNLFPALTPGDLAALIYTSGTTGFPKGVMLSHRNLYANVRSCSWALRILKRDKFLLILPMFHTFSLTVCVLLPIYAGAQIIIVKSLRPFQKVLRAVLFNGVTVIVGIPHLYDILKNVKIPPLLKMLLRVRVCISGAAPLSLQTLSQFKNRFKKLALLEGYGLTEASPVVSINPLEGEQKPGSIGLPIPEVEAKVVRNDETEAGVGEIGELIVRGPNVMQGYLNHPEETKNAIKGGWLFTGDMAKIDSQGYIYIAGRKKEMILSHGMNVYPIEIENVLLSHTKIKEAAVAAKQDNSRGEIPVAFIVLHSGFQASETEIINYCRQRLANYKVPRLIEFKEQLPKTPTGKVLKRKLLENYN